MVNKLNNNNSNNNSFHDIKKKLVTSVYEYEVRHDMIGFNIKFVKH